MAFRFQNPRILATALLCGGLLASSAFCEDTEEKVTEAQLPAAVKATLVQKANGAVLSDFEKETEHGKTVYTAEIPGKDPGTVIEFKVAEDGTFIGQKTEKQDADDKNGKDDEKK
ncbi:MAG: hypothetical protein H0W83_11415 [Planctomycetes bacterium]|nr:hypothetical protein [Planctomycetota bacterium]